MVPVRWVGVVPSSSAVLDPPSVLVPFECSVVRLDICGKVRWTMQPDITAGHDGESTAARRAELDSEQALVRRGLYFSRQNNMSRHGFPNRYD